MLSNIIILLLLYNIRSIGTGTRTHTHVRVFDPKKIRISGEQSRKVLVLKGSDRSPGCILSGNGGNRRLKSEKQIESYLVKKTVERGGKILKFTPSGEAGYADRQVFFPGARSCFVEVKAPGEKPRPLQLKRAKDFAKLGFKTYFVDSYEGVEAFIEGVFGE